MKMKKRATASSASTTQVATPSMTDLWATTFTAEELANPVPAQFDTSFDFGLPDFNYSPDLDNDWELFSNMSHVPTQSPTWASDNFMFDSVTFAPHNSISQQQFSPSTTGYSPLTPTSSSASMSRTQSGDGQVAYHGIPFVEGSWNFANGASGSGPDLGGLQEQSTNANIGKSSVSPGNTNRGPIIATAAHTTELQDGPIDRGAHSAASATSSTPGDDPRKSVISGRDRESALDIASFAMPNEVRLKRSVKNGGESSATKSPEQGASPQSYYATFPTTLSTMSRPSQTTYQSDGSAGSRPDDLPRVPNAPYLQALTQAGREPDGEIKTLRRDPSFSADDLQQKDLDRNNHTSSRTTVPSGTKKQPIANSTGVASATMSSHTSIAEEPNAKNRSAAQASMPMACYALSCAAAQVQSSIIAAMRVAIGQMLAQHFMSSAEKISRVDSSVASSIGRPSSSLLATALPMAMV